jgi:hypothetical protein
MLCEGALYRGFDCTSDNGDGRPIWTRLSSCSLTPKSIHLVKATGPHSINFLRFVAIGFSSPHSQKLVTDAWSMLLFLFPPSFGPNFPLFLFRRTLIGPILPAVGESQQNRDSASSHMPALVAIVMTPGRKMGHAETLLCCSYQKCVLEVRGSLWGRPSIKYSFSDG